MFGVVLPRGEVGVALPEMVEEIIDGGRGTITIGDVGELEELCKGLVVHEVGGHDDDRSSDEHHQG